MCNLLIKGVKSRESSYFVGTTRILATKTFHYDNKDNTEDSYFLSSYKQCKERNFQYRKFTY